VVNADSMKLFVEMFPVATSKLPKFYAYQLDIGNGDKSTIGGKLAYRLKRTFGGHWAWAGFHVVTDNLQDNASVMKTVEELWREQPDTFKGLRTTIYNEAWQASAIAQAEFVARALLSDTYKSITQMLAEKSQALDNATVERIHEVRPWEVNGAPAISVSITSRIVLKEDLRAYVARTSASQLVGLLVADKTSTFKGEITSVVGTIGEHRTRLLALTQREEMVEIIRKSADNDLVVEISNGRNEYEYVIGALRIIPRSEDYARFRVNPRKALAALRIKPQLRTQMVKAVSEILKATGYIDAAYASPRWKESFLNCPSSTVVKFADGKTQPYSEKSIMSDLKLHGLYRVQEKYLKGAPIRACLLNGTGQHTYHEFWNLTVAGLAGLKLNTEVVKEVEIAEASRSHVEAAVSELQGYEPDVIVAFFPDDFADSEDDESAYNHFKSLTVARGIPSQVVEESTLENEKSLRSAVNNVILGIVGKSGNIPYVLARPLDFADVIVGIDVAREKKKRLKGSVNATAIARVYLSDGEFTQYVIHDAPLEGETVPPVVLQSLFPMQQFEGKRVVVHRDGLFRSGEKKALTDWAYRIGATFHLVEVIKSGSPRIYGVVNSEVVQPHKGSAFLISATEALLVSTLPPFADATPQPLRIRTGSSISINQALDSVLALTSLHYGSLRQPRLPVTIHYSDKIAYMALRGIKPKNLEGNVPFWL